MQSILGDQLALEMETRMSTEWDEAFPRLDASEQFRLSAPLAVQRSGQVSPTNATKNHDPVRLPIAPGGQASGGEAFAGEAIVRELLQFHGNTKVLSVDDESLTAKDLQRLYDPRMMLNDRVMHCWARVIMKLHPKCAVLESLSHAAIMKAWKCNQKAPKLKVVVNPTSVKIYIDRPRPGHRLIVEV